MKDIAWRFVAFIVSRGLIADYLIGRSMRTPYFPLPRYMGRWWVFNAYDNDPDKPGTDRDAARKYPSLPSIRVHHILREDLANHPHDHPWDARTIILRGGYRERRSVRRSLGWTQVRHERKRGDTVPIRFGEYHHIEQVSEGGVWTLFFTWRYCGTWGFLVNGKKVPWRQYVAEHPERA